MLLSITCPVLSTFGGSASDIVASQWLENSSNMDQSVKMFVLTTITSLARHMSSSNRNKIIRYLITELKTYRVSLSTIKYMVVALSQVLCLLYCIIVQFNYSLVEFILKLSA